MTIQRHAGMFRPGQSGNPSGRPKSDKTIQDLAKSHTLTALEVLVQIATDVKAPAAVRVQAASAVLDRGWGKPVQYSESNNRAVSAAIVGVLPALRQEDLDERILQITNGTAEISKEEGQKLLQAFLQ
jgi:hypothetical protein